MSQWGGWPTVRAKKTFDLDRIVKLLFIDPYNARSRPLRYRGVGRWVTLWSHFTESGDRHKDLLDRITPHIKIDPVTT